MPHVSEDEFCFLNDLDSKKATVIRNLIESSHISDQSRLDALRILLDKDHLEKYEEFRQRNTPKGKLLKLVQPDLRDICKKLIDTLNIEALRVLLLNSTIEVKNALAEFENSITEMSPTEKFLSLLKPEIRGSCRLLLETQNFKAVRAIIPTSEMYVLSALDDLERSYKSPSSIISQSLETINTSFDESASEVTLKGEFVETIVLDPISEQYIRRFHSKLRSIADLFQVCISIKRKGGNFEVEISADDQELLSQSLNNFVRICQDQDFKYEYELEVKKWSNTKITASEIMEIFKRFSCVCLLNENTVLLKANDKGQLDLAKRYISQLSIKESSETEEKKISAPETSHAKPCSSSSDRHIPKMLTQSQVRSISRIFEDRLILFKDAEMKDSEVHAPPSKPPSTRSTTLDDRSKVRRDDEIGSTSLEKTQKPKPHIAAAQGGSSTSEFASTSREYSRPQSPESRTDNVSRSRPKNAAHCLNILILGETGTGKSTFINSVFNYINFLTFEEAEGDGEEVLVGIPTQFSFISEKGKPVKVKMPSNIFDSNPANEDLCEGNSATQNAQSYLIKHLKSGTRIRLIDTPGIGNARGFAKDQENVSNIISYLRNIEELHAILIIIDPDKSRFTPSLKYCLDQLLLHLHKSAAKNIVFCFTNSSKTQYEIGQTFPLLKRFVEDINKDEELISLDRRTCYTFDNVGFRYLCCLDVGERMGRTARNISIEAWEKSSLSLKRLFNHVASMPSHKTKSTTSMFDAKKCVYALTRPIIDLAKNIAMNLENLSEVHKEMDSVQSKEELLQKMKKAFKMTFEKVDLEKPKTVCTSPNCVEMIEDDNGVKRKNYVTVCHDGCRLIPSPEVIPNSQLKNCASMGCCGICRKCNCSWTTHMHITYELASKCVSVIDSSVVKAISNNASLYSSKREALEQLKQEIFKFETDYNSILRCCVVFSRYLQQGAIAATLDNFLSNLEGFLAVERETVRMGGKNTEMHVIEQLISHYQAEKKKMGNEDVNDEDVDKAIATVCSLRNGGETLNKIIDKDGRNSSQGSIKDFEITFYDPSSIFEEF